MRICDIYIEEFGAIKDKSISLLPGLNLIIGENESGKSTLCAFIKFVFYGFQDAHEREKYSNFVTKTSAGYVVIESEENYVYRIERRDSPSVRSRVTVYNEYDGSVFEDWRTGSVSPGDYFLGVPEKLYGRSVYVSQESGAALDGGSAEAVSNLLISGDEATNLRRAKSTLDGFRREFRLKRGRGGLIPETEDRLEALTEEFRRAQTAKGSAEGLSVEIKRYAREKEECLRELNAKKAVLQKKRASAIRRLQEEKKLAEAGIELNRSRKAEVIRKQAGNGFVPDDGYVHRVTELEKEINIARDSYAELEKSMGAQDSENEPKGYDKFRELGTVKIVSEYEKQRNILNVLRFALIIALTVSGAGFIAFISTFAGFPASRAATVTVFLIFLAAAGAVIYIKKRYEAYVSEFMESIGASDTRTPDVVCRECEDYRNRLGSGARQALSDARKRLDEKKAVLSGLLEKAGKKSVSELKEAYNEFKELTGDIDREYEELEKRSSECDIRLEAYPEKERMGAAGYTETELREAEASPVTEEDVAKSERKVKLAEDSYSNAKLRRAELIGNSDKDLSRLSAEIEETKAWLKEYNLRHDAAALALEMMSEAETSIRQTVSPYLARYAGDYFGRLTEGRYTSLSLDSEMNLRYLGNGNEYPMDSRYLSGGSAELAWLCLRLALHRKLSERETLPVILDECLVYFDDRRLELILQELRSVADNGVQIVLLSASNRERELINKKANVIELE